MDKTFALQVWHTAGMTRGTAPSTATSHLHSDNFTASPDFNTADDVLLTRHRLHDHGHPFSTASLTQPPRISRSAECNEPMQQTIKARRPYRASAGARPCNAPTGRATRTACPKKGSTCTTKHQRKRSNASSFIQMRHSCTFVPLFETCGSPASCIGYEGCISIGGSTHKVALYTKNDNKS